MVWDTMLASALRPGDVIDAVLGLRGTPDEVVIAAPSVEETLDGLWRKAPDAGVVALADWWATAVLEPGGLRVLAPDAASLVAAARVRAHRPHPPSGPPARRRKEGDSKQDARASWRADILIATIAWRNGLPVVTRNRPDFEAVAAELAEIYVAQPPLEVLHPPAGASGDRP